MDCPFSRDQLHELVWGEDPWTPRQIAVLARASLEEPVDAALVRAWLEAAGVAERVPAAKSASAPVAAKPPRPVRVKREKRPGEGTRTVACTGCGVLVTRTPDRFVSEEVFHSRQCCQDYRKRKAQERRAARKAAKGRPAAEGEKLCPKCDTVKPLADYAVDVSRPDGRTRVCRACSNAKSQAYYAANQERLRLAALERHRAGAKEKVAQDPPARITSQFF